MEIKKIFLNFQFDNKSIKALAIARDLAEKYSAQLVIFHEIVDVYMLKRVSSGFGMPVPPDLEEKSRQSAKEKLDDLMANFKGEYRYIIDISGRVKDSIGRFLKEESPDILVLTDEYDYISRKADCNVLIVK